MSLPFARKMDNCHVIFYKSSVQSFALWFLLYPPVANKLTVFARCLVLWWKTRLRSLFLVFRSGPAHRNNENNGYTNSRFCSKTAESRCEYSALSVGFTCLNLSQFLGCIVCIDYWNDPAGTSLPWSALHTQSSCWRLRGHRTQSGHLKNLCI